MVFSITLLYNLFTATSTESLQYLALPFCRISSRQQAQSLCSIWHCPIVETLHVSKHRVSVVFSVTILQNLFTSASTESLQYLALPFCRNSSRQQARLCGIQRYHFVESLHVRKHRVSLVFSIALLQKLFTSASTVSVEPLHLSKYRVSEVFGNDGVYCLTCLLLNNALGIEIGCTEHSWY